MFEIERNISPLFGLREVQDKTFLLLKRKNISGGGCDCNIYRESCLWVKELIFSGALELSLLPTSAPSSEHLTLKANKPASAA